MARKHVWKKRNKKKVIEVSVIHRVSEGDLHLFICDMLFRGLKVTQKTLTDELKMYLSTFGSVNIMNSNTGTVPSNYHPYVNTANYLFKEIFGFTPSKFHSWIENSIKERKNG